MKLALTCLIACWSHAECIPITADQILGRDLFAANPVFVSLVPDQAISFAPAPGVQRTLSTRELERLTGLRSAPICFDRKTDIIDPAIMRSAMAAALEVPEDQIEILDFSHIRVPAGRMEFSKAGLQANGLWRGHVLYGQARSIPVWAKVNAPPQMTEAPNRPAVVKPRIIIPGAMVQVSAVSGQAQITFEAQAQSGGRMGDAIFIRNPTNGRSFRATIVDKGRVEVHPSGD